MPVKTSPVPPVAIPALPVGLTKSAPSGAATIVSAGNLARILGPLWVGWFHLAPTFPFWTAAAVMAIVWLFSWRLLQIPAPVGE